LDFQKKYLTEMRDLQKNFENFKKKTYEEFNQLRKSKEEAVIRKNFYKDSFQKLKEEKDTSENYYRDSYQALKSKLENVKTMVKNNELLRNQLDLSKSEINFLKMKISKLENVQTYLINSNTNNNDNMISPINNLQIDMNYLSDVNEITSNNMENLYSNKSSEIVNYNSLNQIKKIDQTSNILNIFSPPGTVKKTNLMQGFESQNEKKNNFYSYNKESLEENLYKAIDLKKAHENIKDLENSLRSMNEENENLKGKLDNVISSINTPNIERTEESQRYKFNTPNYKTDRNIKKTPTRIKIDKNFTTLTYEEENQNNNQNPVILHSGSFAKKTEIKRTRDLTPPQYRMKESLAQLVETKELIKTSNNALTSNKNSVRSSHRRDISIPCASVTSSRALSKDSFKDEVIEIQNTIEDEIIEFPLQLKIKGRIKKVNSNTSQSSISRKK